MANKNLVPTIEQDQVARMLLVWLNTCPLKPSNIRFEYLRDDTESITVSVTQGAYKTRQFIDGTYEAVLQFSIIYRSQPSSDDERLLMDEVLNNISDWAVNNVPIELGAKKKFKRLTQETRATLYARYDNGDEDHTVSMNLYYEVI